MKQPKKEVLLNDGTKVILRDPKISDARQLLSHLAACAEETDYLLAYAPDIRKRTLESEKNWVRGFKEGESLLIVAEADGKIVGLSEVVMSKSFKCRHRGDIGISIQKAYCDKGLGSIMFDEMIAFGERKGLKQLELGVNNRNDRARHLYEKKGFEYIGRIPGAIYQEDGSYDDELLMVKTLK